MSRLRPAADQIPRLWDQRAGNKPALVFSFAVRRAAGIRTYISSHKKMCANMVEPQSRAGKIVSHYKILEKLAAVAWESFTRPRTLNSAAKLP
jgi:hypothetical protein